MSDDASILKDLWCGRFRLLFWLSAGLGCAALYLALAQPVYESAAVVDIAATAGRRADARPVPQPRLLDLIGTVSLRYELQHPQTPLPKLVEIKQLAREGTPQFVALRTHGAMPQSAQQLAAAIAEDMAGQAYRYLAPQTAAATAETAPALPPVYRLPPTLPSAPIRPLRLTVLVLGLVLGALLGTTDILVRARKHGLP